MYKLEKPLYHGTSKAQALMIVGGYGFHAPIHLTEDKKAADHYGRAATAYLEDMAREQGDTLWADGYAVFTFSSVPDKSRLVADDYNPDAEPDQYKYLKSIKGLRHYTVEYYLLEVDSAEHLRLRCFAIGMWRR